MPDPGRRAGFTLLETLIAVTLGAIIIGLVAAVVVAQSDYYTSMNQRVAAQDNLRSVANLIESELRSVTRGGVASAGADELILYSLISTGIVCGEGTSGTTKGKSGKGTLGHRPVYLRFPGSGLEEDRVAGLAHRDGKKGGWGFEAATWDELDDGTTGAAEECYNFGADTTGGFDRFLLLAGPTASSTGPGEVIGLYAELEYRIDDSVLRPGTLGVFRREGDGSLVELASGLADGTRFQYRRAGETSFQSSVPGGQLTSIEEVLLELRAELVFSGEPDREYRRDVRVLLGNVS